MTKQAKFLTAEAAKSYLSNCCEASIIENTDICSKCGEHCEVEQCS